MLLYSIGSPLNKVLNSDLNMSFQIFTYAYKGNSSDSIIINTDHVLSVYEATYPNSESGEEESVVNLYTVNGNTYQVTESFGEVLNKLNA